MYIENGICQVCGVHKMLVMSAELLHADTVGPINKKVGTEHSIAASHVLFRLLYNKSNFIIVFSVWVAKTCQASCVLYLPS